MGGNFSKRKRAKFQSRSSSISAIPRSRPPTASPPLRLALPKSQHSPKKLSTTPSESEKIYKSIKDDWPWVWAIRNPTILDSQKNISFQPLNLPVKISECLYLGSASCVRIATGSGGRRVDKPVEDKLAQLGITAVLNLAGPLALPKTTVQELKKRGIRYKCIIAKDERSYPLLEKHWRDCYDFIQSSTRDMMNRENGSDANITERENENIAKCGKCLVHCISGVNRSALIMAAYYMITTRTPVLETVQHIRMQRGNVALSNEGFQQQLVALARGLDLLGASPGSEGSIVEVDAPPLPPAVGRNDWLDAHNDQRKNQALCPFSRV